MNRAQALYGMHFMTAQPQQHVSILCVSDPYEASELARLVVVIGSIAGIAGGVAAAGLPLVVPHLFTHDVALHPIMRSVLPQVGAFDAGSWWPHH